MKKQVTFFIISCITFSYSQVVLVPQSSLWTYLDDGSNQGIDWISSGFDDSAWKTGFAQLGYGDGDEATVVSYGSSSNNKFPTTYCRIKFQLTNPVDYKYYIVRILRDDGAVVYLNGNEALRSNMPQGIITYKTYASSSVSGSGEDEFYEYYLNNQLVVAGENTIAVSIHQRNGSSSDISFDLELIGTDELSLDSDGPYVFYHDNEIIVKSIIESGPQVESYADKASVNLSCYITELQDGFSVKLKNELPVEENEFGLPEKVLAISDIEGNFKGFKMILQGAGAIDGQYNWTYGEGHLILVGDIFDRGNYVTQCLWLIYKLESEAEEAGGKVHFILGNHDIMNMIEDLRYVHPKYFINASLLEEEYYSFYTTDTELGRWLRTKNVIEKVGDYIFVHGGVSPTVANFNLSLNEMNDLVRYCIDQSAPDYNSAILIGSNGLFWYRGLVYRDISELQLDSILEKLNSSKIIMGHTIVNKISGLYNNKVVAIDLDHEENTKDGFMYALLIDQNNFYIIDDNSDTEFLFGGTISGISPQTVLAEAYVLLPAYPNPFNPETTIGFEIRKAGHVTLTVYNMMGQKVATLLNHDMALGYHSVAWTAGNEAAGGIYFYKIIVSGHVSMRKMVLLK